MRQRRVGGQERRERLVRVPQRRRRAVRRSSTSLPARAGRAGASGSRRRRSPGTCRPVVDEDPGLGAVHELEVVARPCPAWPRSTVGRHPAVLVGPGHGVDRDRCAGRGRLVATRCTTSRPPTSASDHHAGHGGSRLRSSPVMLPRPARPWAMPGTSTMLATATLRDAEQRGGGEHHERDRRPVRRTAHQQHDRDDHLEEEEAGPGARERRRLPLDHLAQHVLRAEQAHREDQQHRPERVDRPEHRAAGRPQRGSAQLDRAVLAVEPGGRASRQPSATSAERERAVDVHPHPEHRHAATGVEHRLSAASRVSASSTRPISSGRGAHTDEPTPSTQAGDDDAPGERPGRPGQAPHHGAPAVAVSSPISTRRPSGPDQRVDQAVERATPASSGRPRARPAR